MSDYYHQFLSSMSGAGPHPVTTPDEPQPAPFSAAPMQMPGGPMGTPYQNLGYFTGYPDPIVFNSSKSQKGRRKSGAGIAGGIDHVKHRRTRSGCFMCRSRRVKCDETRPVCERCRKGNRECVYPDPPASKGAAGQAARSKEAAAATQQGSPLSSNDEDEEDEDEVDQETKLDTIHDEEEPDERAEQSSTVRLPRSWSVASSNTQQLSGRGGSETPSQEGNKSSSPSASTATTASFPTGTYQPSDLSFPPGVRPDWSHLPTDFQQYLNWFVENLTHFHYCMGIDHDDFFKTILLQVAVRNEPLLNAIVGFSAYHATLRNPNGKVEDFLQYYNKSVTLLLNFLKRKEKHNAATLLTILQLATIEEYLGDWVNLMGHQKAAFEIITKMFTPQNVMQTPMGRMCLNWYARFDNFVALMGGFPTDLPRDWFNASIAFHQSQVAATDALRCKIEERSARLRLITYDMSIVFARGSRGQLSPTEFIQEHDKLSERLLDWKNTWDPALSDASYLVTEFPHKQPLDPDDFVDPYSPGILYEGPLFSSTVISAEWHSIMIMHKCQSSNTPPELLFAELRNLAYTTCRYFETLEFWPSTPKGALVLMQAGIAISTLFLPQDEQHHKWLRRKFARLENMGYIHPLSIRTKMAELFREPSCVNWWLPNNEGFSPVLQSVRDFADDRNAAAVTAQQESLREVRHIFAKLELSDQASEMVG